MLFSNIIWFIASISASDESVAQTGIFRAGELMIDFDRHRLLLSHDLAAYLAFWDSWETTKGADWKNLDVDYSFIHRKVLPALREKGVSWEIIEEAMEECCDGDAAQEAIRELLRKRRYDPDTASPEETRKTLAYLMRKGFRYDDVRQVIQVSEWNA